MNSNDISNVQHAIKTYIESIDDYKIKKYHNDDLKSAYKLFINNFLQRINPFLKEDVSLKDSVEMVKKEKKGKAQDEVDFLFSKFKKIEKIIETRSSLDSFLIPINETNEEIRSLKRRNKFEIWIDWALKNGKGIYLATHVAKLSHSSSKSSSIDYRFYESDCNDRKQYLVTRENRTLILDWAYPDNALSSIAAFYDIRVSGFFVGDLLRNNSAALLKNFTDSEEKARQWSEGFGFNIREEIKSSHFLSKQVYYPIDNENYHLLLPLVSSSIAHALFLKFKTYFDDESTLIREQKNKNKYHDKPAVSYLNRSSLNITGSNHSNASSLNGKRGGRITLLPCTPPKWPTGQQLPVKQASLFNRQLGFKLQEEINSLQRLLLVIKSKEIGSKRPEILRAIVKNIHEIAQGFFIEVIKIALLSNEKGWTKNCSMPLAQQLLIEPHRDDDEAVQEKNQKQWQAEIADEFSVWLNKQLKHKHLNLTPIQQRLWKDIFKSPLRDFIASQEVA